MMTYLGYALTGGLAVAVALLIRAVGQRILGSKESVDE